MSGEDAVLAEQAKNHGNDLFAKKDFSGAIRQYNRALALDRSNAGFFCNRSAARLALKHEEWAVDDAVNATRLEPSSNPKRWSRLGSALAACERRIEAKQVQ